MKTMIVMAYIMDSKIRMGRSVYSAAGNAKDHIRN